MKLTQSQIAVITTLYDVATHEGGGIVLKNRYHSAAHALIRKGLACKIERGFYRPHYIITPAGSNYWTAHLLSTGSLTPLPLTFYIPTYAQTSAMRSPSEKLLPCCPAAELIDLVKERSQHAQAAAVVLLHDHYKKSQLPRYFSEAEIQRYFRHLSEN